MALPADADPAPKDENACPHPVMDCVQDNGALRCQKCGARLEGAVVWEPLTISHPPYPGGTPDGEPELPCLHPVSAWVTQLDGMECRSCGARRRRGDPQWPLTESIDHPKVDPDDEIEMLVDVLGPDVWIALSFRRGLGRWPEEMKPKVLAALADCMLVDPVAPDHPDAPGVPTPLATAVLDAANKRQEKLAARYDAEGEHDLAKAVRSTLNFRYEMLEVPPPPPTTPPTVANADLADNLRKLTKDPAAMANASAQFDEMMAFLQRVAVAVANLAPHLDTHYRGELTAISKDLIRDLGLSDVTKEQANQVLLLFLQHPPDDDDTPEPAPVPPQDDGEKVIA